MLFEHKKFMENNHRLDNGNSKCDMPLRMELTNRATGNKMEKRVSNSNRKMNENFTENISSEISPKRCPGNRFATIRNKEEPTDDPKRYLNVVVFGYFKVGKSSLIGQLVSWTGSLQHAKRVKEKSKIFPSTETGGRPDIKYTENLPTSQIGCEVYNIDVCLVLFSVSDKTSFKWAADKVAEIRSLSKKMNVFMVANKIDLVRSTTVSKKYVKTFCKMHGCKYHETSLVLEYQVNSLCSKIMRKQQKKFVSQQQTVGPYFKENFLTCLI